MASNQNNNKENHNPQQTIEKEMVVTLRNGVQMPVIGIGTSHTGGYSHSSVVYALKECGYRLVDTAKRYGTEEFIRYAIAESGVPRESLFLTTKLWPIDCGFETAKAALRGSLTRLGVEYLDLFLIHYPEVPSRLADHKWQVLADTWRALESLYDEGLVRAIGVSNYSADDIEHQEAAGEVSMKPMLNQLEFHPYHRQTSLIEYCVDNRIQVQGYCPLGNGNLVNQSAVVQIAHAVSRTPAQVLIRWSLQHQVPTIPKSTKRERVQENIGVFDFELSSEQMATLDALTAANIKYIEVDSIQDKIDSNLPDGYKLDKNIRENLLQT